MSVGSRTCVAVWLPRGDQLTKFMISQPNCRDKKVQGLLSVRLQSELHERLAQGIANSPPMQLPPRCGHEASSRFDMCRRPLRS